jgi:sugar lactone lactonase YvrE
MTTPDLTIDSPESPAPPVEQREDNRRRKLLLLLLLGLLVIMLALSVWYLLFRKPISEIPLPIAPTAMPTYQYAFYGLTKPQGVAVSPDGSRIYVTQTNGASETVMLDGRGAVLGVLKPPAAIVAQAHQLYAAVNPVTAEVWATDRYDSAVFIYAADGTYQRVFDQGPALAAWQPLGIAFDQKGNVYISDVGGGTQLIHVFSPDGKLLRDIGAANALDHPNGIAVEASGTIYVTDTGNGRLLEFDTSGVMVGTVARGNAPGNLGLPVGMGIDDHGHILVADSSSSTVQAYAPMKAGDRGPAYIDSFGVEGSVDGTFLHPNGLTVDSRGRVYVADWGNDRLQVWSY